MEPTSQEELYANALRQVTHRLRNDVCLDMLKTTTNNKLIVALLENYIRDSFELESFLTRDTRLDLDDQKYIIKRYFINKSKEFADSRNNPQDVFDDVECLFECLQPKPDLVAYAREMMTLMF